MITQETGLTSANEPLATRTEGPSARSKERAPECPVVEHNDGSNYAIELGRRLQIEHPTMCDE